MRDEKKPTFVDRPIARGVAFLVFLGCLGLLAYLHRDDFFPSEEPEAAAVDDPAAVCIAERRADIERMVEEGLIDEGQAVVFRERAIGMCRDTAGGGGGGGGPTLPGLPQQ